MDWSNYPLFAEAEELYHIARCLSDRFNLSLEGGAEFVKLALIDRHTDALKHLANAVDNTYFPERFDVSLCGDLDVRKEDVN